MAAALNRCAASSSIVLTDIDLLLCRMAPSLSPDGSTRGFGAGPTRRQTRLSMNTRIVQSSSCVEGKSATIPCSFDRRSCISRFCPALSLHLRPCLNPPEMTCLPVLFSEARRSLAETLCFSDRIPHTGLHSCIRFSSPFDVTPIHHPLWGRDLFARRHPWRWGFLPAWSCSLVVMVVVIKT